ncbi:MAG TPA: NADH-quinone oxidoreductase subunit C, partial [Nitrospira sp.]|nr:NADH-quinone oxidoreductase subunit C [Nitrospira sp.]
MPDGLTAAARVQEAFPQGIIQVGSMQGVPMLRLRKPDVPAVARYIHTDPELRGSLSLLWAIDHRPREARDELWYLFTLAARKDWLLLTVDLAEEEREFASITPMVHAAKWYERE